MANVFANMRFQATGPKGANGPIEPRGKRQSRLSQENPPHL